MNKIHMSVKCQKTKINKMPVFGCPKENQLKLFNNEPLTHFRPLSLFYTICP